MSTAKSGGMQKLAETLSDPAMVYKAIIVILAAAAIMRLFSHSRPSYELPLRTPLEIALTTYVVSTDSWGRRIYSVVRRYNGSLFGIFKSHQVLVDLPNLDKFMSQGHSYLDYLRTQITLMMRVFGAEDSQRLIEICDTTAKSLVNIIEREFTGEAASTAALERGDVAQKISSLISHTDVKEHMYPWEQSANIKVMARGPSGAVEADLMGLMRHFGGHVAIPVLYGKDFMLRYPTLLDDLWKFDNDLFPLLMVGIPTWAPFKMIREGVEAHTRLLREMEALYRRIDQYQKGEPVDFGADLSDVGIAWERNKIYAKHDVPFRMRSDMDIPILWGQNANTQPLLFWHILYIHSTPGLVDILRKEIAPYVQLSSGPGPVEVKSMQISALHRDCPLMKSSLFETFRLGNEATSIRRVAKPLTVADGQYQHQLQPGSYVSAFWSLHQYDPAVYLEPERFVPERFIDVDIATGRKLARYGPLRPWSVGPGSCKGRTFAEKEIITIAACLLSVWDLEPAAGKWKIPKSLPGTGAKRPANDVRVIFRRRFNN